MTKEQAMQMARAVEDIRKKTNYDPKKGYRWTIILNWANHKEFIISRYSSIVSGFGFISRHDAEDFLKDPDGLRLLKEMYFVKD